MTAINDVSFHVNPGEVLGVVGESGSGKSVTGLAAMGLIDPPGRISAAGWCWKDAILPALATRRCEVSAAAASR